MLIGVPRQHPMNLVQDMLELQYLLKRLREQQTMACDTCVFGRKPTPKVLDDADEFRRPELVGDRLVCLRGMEQDPIVSGYSFGGTPALVLVHPKFSCLLFEARR